LPSTTFTSFPGSLTFLLMFVLSVELLTPLPYEVTDYISNTYVRILFYVFLGNMSQNQSIMGQLYFSVGGMFNFLICPTDFSEILC
jgi:hypothetical protein